MAPIYYQGLSGAIDASAIEGQRMAALTDVAKGCMAQKGYIQVAELQMDDALAAFRKTAKEREKLKQ